MQGAVHQHNPAHSLSMQCMVAVRVDTQCTCRVRDKVMPELGIRLEDRADGSPNVNEMSADEQHEVRKPSHVCSSRHVLGSKCIQVHTSSGLRLSC